MGGDGGSNPPDDMCLRIRFSLFFSLPLSRQNELNKHNGTEPVTKARIISCRGLGGRPKSSQLVLYLTGLAEV
jgi:hypothetical protein